MMVSMKHFAHLPITRLVMITLLIAGIILLCPVKPTYSASTQCTNNPMQSHDYGTNDVNNNCAGNHTEIGGHAANVSVTTNYLAVLFAVGMTLLLFLSRRLLFASYVSYLARLKYFWRRHRLTIKPKLVTIFLSWLNLLSYSIAYKY